MAARLLSPRPGSARVGSACLIAACLAVCPAALALTPADLPAQDSQQGVSVEVPNARYNFIGEIQGNNVIVRSGPADSHYAVTKLNRGTRVKVVGIRHEHLKIEPPPGSFSYVGKAYVERHGDGTKGKVNTTANVRTGSDQNAMKTYVQTKLEPGMDVKILGEQDEYYKIEPPPGAYVYVHQQYVKPIGIVGGTGIAQAQPEQPGTQAPADADPVRPQEPNAAEAARPETAPPDGAVTRGSDGQLPQTAEQRVEPTAPDAAATQPEAVAATRPGGEEARATETKFEQLEAQFEAAGERPVIEQPLDELLTGYTAVAADENLPASLKRVADARIAAIKVRQEAREQFRLALKGQQEMRQRSQALVAEREELEQRLEESKVEFYTAVGTLRPSNLQHGPRGTTLYRLTDPATGRTVVYLRAKDASVTANLNQFVGVRGELTTDPQLKLRVITPTETKPVDQAKVGNEVAAAVIPPSILPKITVSGSDAAVPATAD